MCLLDRSESVEGVRETSVGRSEAGANRSHQAKRVALGWEYSGETWCALLQAREGLDG